MRTLPNSYRDINYKTYVAIINKIPSDKPDGVDKEVWSRVIHMATLSILLDCSEAEIEAMRYVKVGEMIKSIAFLEVPFKPTKTAFKVKEMETLSYDEFSTYQRLRLDQWNNLGDILLLFLKDTTPEQVDNMSIEDAMQVFFCLNKSTQRFLRRLKYSTIRKAIWQTIKNPSTLWQKRDSFSKNSFGTFGDGLT